MSDTQTYRVTVKWSVSSVVEVQAASLKEAIEKVED